MYLELKLLCLFFDSCKAQPSFAVHFLSMPCHARQLRPLSSIWRELKPLLDSERQFSHHLSQQQVQFNKSQKNIDDIYRLCDCVTLWVWRCVILCLRSLLGLGSVKYLEPFTFSELSRLVYKDQVDVKHADRSSMRKALEDAQQNDKQLAAQLSQIKDEDKKTAYVNPVAELLLDHLLQVAW